MADSGRRDFLIKGAALGVAAALPGCTDAPYIPPPRPVPWKMKGLASAQTRFEVLPDGRLFLGIRHDVLRGIAPAMLVWWFQNLEGELTVGGKTWPRYLVWHPVDHIAVRYARRLPDGSVGPGAKIHIQEAFGARPEYFVNAVTTIEKLDETGFVHAARVAGLDLARPGIHLHAGEGRHALRELDDRRTRDAARPPPLQPGSSTHVPRRQGARVAAAQHRGSRQFRALSAGAVRS